MEFGVMDETVEIEERKKGKQRNKNNNKKTERKKTGAVALANKLNCFVL